MKDELTSLMHLEFLNEPDRTSLAVVPFRKEYEILEMTFCRSIDSIGRGYEEICIFEID